MKNFNLHHFCLIIFRLNYREGYRYADDSVYHNKYGVFFIQTDFWQKFSNIDWGVSFRLSSSLHEFEWQVDGKKNEDTFFMFHVEPMAFVRLGWDHLKFSPRIGWALSIPTSSFDVICNAVSLDYSRTTMFHVSLGVNYTF